MRRRCLPLLFCTILALIAATSSAEVLHQTLRFSASDLRFARQNGYDAVTMDGAELAGEPGEPQLPVYTASVALPTGAKVQRVELSYTEKEQLLGEHLLYPAQPPRILSTTEKIAFVPPEPEIYESDQLYPGEVLRCSGTGHVDGCPLVDLLIFPLQYRPAQRALVLHTRVDLTVHYTPSSAGERSTKRATDTLLKHLVLNEPWTSSTTRADTVLPNGEFDYVIITSDDLDSCFQPLADWKTKKGVPATVVTTSWIYSNYSQGANAQEKIRNFIRDAHVEWGTVWVLLGGDTYVVPDRDAFAMSSGYQGDDIPCDLYYADLDGDWNRDGDGIYGEVADSVDLYPDLFIGRASVEDVEEAQIWVTKVLTYEKSPPLDYTTDLLFLGEVLWHDPFTDAGVNKDMIDELYISSRFDPITKLYRTLGNENPASVIAALNEGHHIVNHDGHAWTNCMGMGTGYIYLSDFDALTNAPRYSILYSTGCWPAAFDNDCMAERFIANPDGGGVAFVGNSRYGWGSPGNPGYGYSDRFDQQFFRFLLHEEIHHIGLALAAAKALYVPRSRGENVYRWHQYQLNLIGDPEMPVWTDTPQEPTVVHPTIIPFDTLRFTVTVADGVSPVEGALVCLKQGHQLYHRGYTGISGQISFVISPTSTEPVKVTVTGHNLLPYEGISAIRTTGPHVCLWSYAVDDRAGGDGDGLINPHETIYLSAVVSNCGQSDADSVLVSISSMDTSVTMIDTVEQCGDVKAGQSVERPQAFQFAVGSCPNGYPLEFTLTMVDAVGHRWTELLNMPVATPLLVYERHVVIDSAGNENGLLDPGEAADLDISLRNDGLDRAEGIVLHLSTDDANLVIADSVVDFGECRPDSTAKGRFAVQVSPSCPTPHFPLIYLWATADHGSSYRDSILMTVGETGFADDLENGAVQWTHGGTEDLWHITSNRSHSGDHSWYCGNEDMWLYDPNMNCSLVSPPIALAPQSKLLFWRWFDVAVYGVNGFYVEVLHGTEVDMLDFIGSGGALDSLLMGDDWFCEEYDLSSYSVGDTVQVQFRFVSDEEPEAAEGAYIDDIVVVGAGQGGWVSADEEAPPALPERFVLRQNCPNPFNPTTEIAYALPEECQVKLEVYNLLGQRVRTLVNGHQPGGMRRITWEGTNDQGLEVAAGIYFYRLRAGGYTSTRRMVLLK